MFLQNCPFSNPTEENRLFSKFFKIWTNFFLIFQRVVIKNVSSRLSRWIFPVTTGLIFFTKVKISKVTPREEDSSRISASWFLVSKTGHSQKSKVFLTLDWLLSLFNIIILCNCRVVFFQQNLNRKIETFAIFLK